MVSLVEFESHKIRRPAYKGECFFSLVDILAASVNPPDASKYWYDVKKKIIKMAGLPDGTDLSQLSENFRKFKLLAPDGKMRMTDCANLEGVFRVSQPGQTAASRRMPR